MLTPASRPNLLLDAKGEEAAEVAQIKTSLLPCCYWVLEVVKRSDGRKGFQVLLLVALGVIVGLAASCRPAAPPVDPVTLAHGKALYHALACDSCHGLDAVGSTRSYAPTHNHMRAMAGQRILASDYTGQARSAADYIRESIVDPTAYVVDGYRQIRFGMPSFAYLTERDLDALVQFLLQQE
jgi:mono/diheme cytochrome c family protein